MKNTCPLFLLLTFAMLAVSGLGQATIVINTPGGEPVKPVLSAADQRVFDRSVLPKVRKRLGRDGCEESVDMAGVLHGAFSRKVSSQTAIFYQFCQTGNGLGSVGVAVLENGKAIGNYVNKYSGWTYDAKALPDINRNGLDEIALYYSGGMHQGAGGTGVDIMEVSGGGLRGIGWYQAEGFTDTSSDFAYKVTVKPGTAPVFFREKYVANSAGKYRKTGKLLPLRLTKTTGKFEALK